MTQDVLTSHTLPMSTRPKNPPGQVRDAIVKALEESAGPLTVKEITERVGSEIGATPASSIRSYLRLNTPGTFVREGRGLYRVRAYPANPRQKYFGRLEGREAPFVYQQSVLHNDDCFSWIAGQPENSIHAVVTDPLMASTNTPTSSRPS